MMGTASSLWYAACSLPKEEPIHPSPHMINVKHSRLKPLWDPAPNTCTNEDIRKAQAIREALRRRFVNDPKPNVDPYWTIGAD